MRAAVHTSISALIVAGLLITGGLLFIPSANADEPALELVPEPWVHETHEYDVPGDDKNTNGMMINEKWSIEVRHGDVMTLIMARNMTQDDQTGVDYTLNIHYYIGDTLYIAQFMMIYAAFVIGNDTIFAPLSTCEGFELNFTPIQYDGTVPSMYCNITFEGIQVYQDASKNSTFDLTLCHHIVGDWNRTDIKVEALFDLSDTRFIDIGNDIELNTGELFTAKIHYMMMLHDPETFSTDGPIIPTGHTDTNLEYNLTLDNGAPLSVSKLKMKDDFTVYNASGSYASVGGIPQWSMARNLRSPTDFQT